MRPTRHTMNAAGADLSIKEDAWLMPFQTRILKTGYCYDIPRNSEIRPRSSVALRGILVHHGTIDTDYYGREVGIVVTNLTPFPKKLKAGRIAQLLVVQDITGIYFDLAADAVVRTGGFGSTN